VTPREGRAGGGAEGRARALRRLTRPLRHALAARLLTALAALAARAPRLSPLLGAALGVGVGVGLWLCGARAARVALGGLRRLGGGWPLAARYCASWADLGRRVGEWLAAPAGPARVRLSPGAEALLAEARAGLARGEVWVALTGHLGHWELLGAALAARGAPLLAVAAAPKAGALGDWLAARRARLGVRVTHPGAAGAALRGLLRAPTGGERRALCFLIDQSVAGRARPLPFLGAPAPTAALPARLIAAARRRGRVTRVLWVAAPRGAGGWYEVAAEDLSAHPDPLARATERLDALVRAHPAQWVWLNDRWRPRGARRAWGEGAP